MYNLIQLFGDVLADFRIGRVTAKSRESKQIDLNFLLTRSFLTIFGFVALSVVNTVK